jgi:hypothetical protein
MTTIERNLTPAQTFRAVIVPMFKLDNMEQPMAKKATTQLQQAELSLLDVKELYDLAYSEKDKGAEGEAAFKKILAEAVKLDLAYRRQLTKDAMYKEPSKLKNFETASEAPKTGSKVA